MLRYNKAAVRKITTGICSVRWQTREPGLQQTARQARPDPAGILSCLEKHLEARGYC